MHDFHTEHDCENILRKSTIKIHKKLKIYLMNITESSVKGRIKEHKKTGNKKNRPRKRMKITFFFSNP